MPGELLEDPSVRLQTPRLCAPGRRSPCLQSAARQPRQRPKPWAGAKRSLPRPPGAVCKSEHQEVAGTSRPSSATASSSSAAPGRRRRSLRAVAPPGRSPCSLQPAAGGAAAPPGPPPAPRTPRAPAPSYPAGPPRRGPSSDPRPPWSAAAAPRLTHGAGESRAGPGQGGVGSARRGGEYARMPSACGDGPGSAIAGAGGSAGVSVPRPQGRGGRTAGPSGAAPRAGCCPRAGGEACLHAERARGRDPRGTPGLHSPVSPPGRGPSANRGHLHSSGPGRSLRSGLCGGGGAHPPAEPGASQPAEPQPRAPCGREEARVILRIQGLPFLRLGGRV